PQVHALVWRMMGSSGDASAVDDLVQDTFTRVFQSLGSFSLSGPARLSSWILTIATRLVLNHRRKKRPALGLMPDALAGGRRADSAVRRNEIGNALARAIGQLRPASRVVVLLREYHGLSYEEIAAATEVDVGTVKSRLSRAKSKLRAALSEIHHG
ncbi:MAG: RNA polymerase sigma factor, partial [Deltaproteobacteria bacterium]|nr:RNA polymerase sigma factor [Deltaproteobacteria bacterium]